MEDYRDYELSEIEYNELLKQYKKFNNIFKIVFIVTIVVGVIFILPMLLILMFTIAEIWLLPAALITLALLIGIPLIGKKVLLYYYNALKEGRFKAKLSHLTKKEKVKTRCTDGGTDTTYYFYCCNGELKLLCSYPSHFNAASEGDEILIIEFDDAKRASAGFSLTQLRKEAGFR
ncbi:MAG: hypothetical protein FWD34_00795 [Oscillospiraceae bacterium]|nr:hypothetical protein [Oscillospiraceae bacterium]